ncbi:signal recognition particle-docking protein FtsY [Haloterrigena turkmenica DSM 5511]|uniref:Signal recognition particle receptor FtsY n=1 Tax=Haloterrigena turkmenica (strain ATCC 51198 / DSM 5511 / JCM 9101 / NCIMB 13204 / VKM B-1734 / 4k) TaxID=543526 RepID=D2RU71_HALTV|nr:signal recognition particle-docking protein FtsY [Haloterrigena turkmenica]ADB59140.1 signal recognition particle-docking protein FtsY [Haloterrigena turkmenica DSM 5511]
MFDNLKEKLGSFRKDAEEAAEENVEEVDEDELEEADVEELEAESESAAGEDDATTPDAPDTTGEPVDEPEGDLEAETAAPDETTAGAEPETDEPEPASTSAATETADAAETAGAASTDDPSAAEPEPEAESEPDSEPETETESEADEEESSGLDLKGIIKRGSEADEQTDETEDEPAADVEPADGAESELEAETAAGAETASAETADAVEADALEDEEEDADAEADADEESSSTGFGTKARSLVKGKFVIEEEDLEAPLHELEMALLSSDVEMGVTDEILDNLRDELIGETRSFTTSTGDVIEEALRDAIYDVISVGQFDFDERIAAAEKPVTIVFTGVNGVGKTTSIAKLSRYFEERGYSTVMANGDTYRAGANEQIEQHAEALGTKLITHEQGGDPAAVLYDGVEYAEANDIDVVLGDTAGRLHTNEGLMDQLEKIDRVVGPDMTLFVDEAVAGQDAVNRAREFNEAAEIDGAILTKADADSNGGAAISIAHVTGKPILFLGVGQGYDDLEPFDPEEMVDRLLEDDE